jgi:FAD/FMN-containing dehydrogenase
MALHEDGILSREPLIQLKSSPQFESFRKEVRGSVITEEDKGYEEARKVWNGMIDKKPGLIVKCTGNADVIQTIKFARNQNLKLSVRGGSHNVSGNAVCDDGVVIDLSNMRNIRVDAENKVARVGGGATLGDLDHETQAFALAVPAGAMSRTGVAGLTLNGGLGLLTRKYGLSSDNLIGADVITADGKMIIANENQNTDLLWALKGGGGSFGVVTSFEFRLHSVGPEVWVAMILYPLDNAFNIMKFFRDFMSNAPDEIMGIAIFWSNPDEHFIPEEYKRKPNLVLVACYSGPVEKGEEALMPLRTLDQPVADLSGPMPFTSAQQLFDPEYPNGRRYYWKSTYLKGLEDEAIQLLIDYALQRPSAITSLDIWALGGAMSRVKPDDTAFAQRETPFLLGIESNWNNPSEDEENISWSRQVYQDFQRFSNGGTYLNFPGFGEEGQTMMRQSFGINYDRLRMIKKKYDPENIFSGSINILSEE